MTPESRQSTLPPAVWQALQALDPAQEETAPTLAVCLALVEQRFQHLFAQLLQQMGEVGARDLNAEADALADAHHALSLLQDSLQATSRRMLEVLDRVSRELGE